MKTYIPTPFKKGCNYCGLPPVYWDDLLALCAVHFEMEFDYEIADVPFDHDDPRSLN